MVESIPEKYFSGKPELIDSGGKVEKCPQRSHQQEQKPWDAVSLAVLRN